MKGKLSQKFPVLSELGPNMCVYIMCFLKFVTNVVGVLIKLPATIFHIMSLDHEFNSILNCTSY